MKNYQLNNLVFDQGQLTVQNKDALGNGDYSLRLVTSTPIDFRGKTQIIFNVNMNVSNYIGFRVMTGYTSDDIVFSRNLTNTSIDKSNVVVSIRFEAIRNIHFEINSGTRRVPNGSAIYRIWLE